MSSSTISGEESPMMCSSSRSPAFGLIGTIGTPAANAPTTATTVSSRVSATTATRDAPETRSATAPAADASCSYVSAFSPTRTASRPPGSRKPVRSTAEVLPGEGWLTLADDRGDHARHQRPTASPRRRRRSREPDARQRPADPAGLRRSTRPPTGKPPSQAAEQTLPGPDRPRHRPAGHRRRRGVPPRALVQRRARPDAHGAGHRARQGGRLRGRRRRLRHQAVQRSPSSSAA